MGRKRKKHRERVLEHEGRKAEFVAKLNAFQNPEKMLFDALIAAGYKVERNKPIQISDNGRYRIVDIVFEEKNLFIEVDGESHIGMEKRDRKREREIFMLRQF